MKTLLQALKTVREEEKSFELTAPQRRGSYSDTIQAWFTPRCGAVVTGAAIDIKSILERQQALCHR